MEKEDVQRLHERMDELNRNVLKALIQIERNKNDISWVKKLNAVVAGVLSAGITLAINFFMKGR